MPCSGERARARWRAKKPGASDCAAASRRKAGWLQTSARPRSSARSASSAQRPASISRWRAKRRRCSPSCRNWSVTTGPGMSVSTPHTLAQPLDAQHARPGRDGVLGGRVARRSGMHVGSERGRDVDDATRRRDEIVPERAREADVGEEVDLEHARGARDVDVDGASCRRRCPALLTSRSSRPCRRTASTSRSRSAARRRRRRSPRHREALRPRARAARRRALRGAPSCRARRAARRARGRCRTSRR